MTNADKIAEAVQLIADVRNSTSNDQARFACGDALRALAVVTDEMNLEDDDV